jgi:hypothetical protein
MNGETIITAENIGLAAEVICAELPNPYISNGSDILCGSVYIKGGVLLHDLVRQWYVKNNVELLQVDPPTLAELRDEVRERFREYLI